MNLVESLSDVPDRKIVLAAGAFDGLHKGHVAVLETARNLARAHQAEPGILRFYPHPSRILTPETSPPLLGTEETLAERLDDLGIHLHIRLPFSKKFARQEPEEFLQHLKDQIPGLKGMVVGSNWRFGYRGRGDVELLSHWGHEHGVEIRQTPDTFEGEEMISSTRIRNAIRSGDLASAAGMLGHPYSLKGTVKKGKQYGRDLGFPTANFTPGQECLPPEGVYAMRVLREGADPMTGAGYITHTPALVEVHLLGFSGDLYGQTLTTELLEFRRPATPIRDKDVLQARIQNDVEGIRREYAG